MSKLNLPNEIINLIFSYMGNSPVNQLMKTEIRKWKQINKKYRERFYKNYFSITNERIAKIKKRIWNLTRYSRKFDNQIQQMVWVKHQYQNMSFQERIGTKEDIKKRDKEYEDLKFKHRSLLKKERR